VNNSISDYDAVVHNRDVRNERFVTGDVGIVAQ